MILVAPRPRFALPRFHAGAERAAPSAEAPPVTHRFALSLESGKSEAVPQPACCVLVRCTDGSVWITHDGDPKDVVLGPGESYSAPRPGSMLVHALRPSAVEMHFSHQRSHVSRAHKA
jgi:hypothetical protein